MVATFEFDRSVTLSTTPDTAWKLMTDVPRLVEWITVVGDADEVVPLERYTAVIEDRMGMFSLRADLDITLVDVEVGSRVRVRAEGQDRQVGSRITIDADVDLRPDSSTTEVRVKGGYEVTGRAATLGSGQIRRKGEQVIDEFFTQLGNASG